MARGWLGLGALVLAAAAAGDAPAATRMTSFRVTVTVVSRCTVAPWPAAGPACLRQPGPQIQLAAPPIVTYARDPNAGALVKTVEF